ncbi:MAG: M3 family metallopeptidase, partial [Pseudomonadota bacterium]
MTHTISGPWTAPYGLPDYSAIKEDDFVSAIEAAMIEDRSEIEAIKGAGPVTFANTIEALERSGQALSRACSIFYTKVSSDTTSALQEMERTVGPKLAAHGQATALDRALWERVKSVSSDGLTPEQARVLELTRRWFKKSGADLDEAGRARLREITQELSKLGTQFSQTVLEDEQTGGIVLSNDDLEGLPDWLVDAAKRESLARNASGPVITVSRSMAVPFLQSSPHRHLREQLWRAWTARGEEKNWPVIARTLQLRQETAQLLGYATFADMRLEHQMAGAPDRVDALLKTVWAPAHAKALADQAALEELLAADGINGPLAPWDWQYYAEQQRQALHSLSDAELKPYLSLDNMITAAFD